MTLEEYLKKYGYEGLSVVMAEFIRRSPAFPGDGVLATQLGIMMADLQSALQDGAALIRKYK